MKIKKSFQLSVVAGMLCGLAGSAYAYSEDDRSRACKNPRFRDFEPGHLSEVEPGSEVSFHFSSWADPDTLKISTKKIPMEYTVEDRMTFYIARAKLPPSLAGQFARLHLYVKAKEGICRAKDGWLLKIKEAAPVVEPEVVDETGETLEGDAE